METIGYITTAKLITPNERLGIFLIDSDYNVKFYKKLDNINEETNIGIVKNGDIGVIAGSGEVFINLKKG